GDDLGETAVARGADHPAVADAGNAEDHGLHVERRHPLPRHLQHVVAAPEDAERAIGLLDGPVAGREPAAAERARRRIATLPVARGDAVAADAEASRLAAGHGHPALVDDLHLVARHGTADGARAAGAGPRREEDVERLRR